MSKFIRILISLLLLGYVLYMSGLFSKEGWSDLGRTCADANLYLLAFTIVFTYFIDYVSSIKWYYLAKAREMKVGLNRLYVLYLIGRFFNLILPTSIGGDVVRIAQLAKITGRTADSAAVVFVERFTGFLVLMMLAVLSAFIVFDKQTSIPWLLPSAVAGLAVMVAGMFLLISNRLIQLTGTIFGCFGKFGKKVFEKLEKFHSSIIEFRNAPSSLFWAFINSLLFYAVAIFNVWVSLKVFTDHVSFIDILSAVPLIMFIMNLPLSVGGIGLMEFAYTLILGLYGFDPAVAVSTALLMRLKSLIMGGSGGLLFLLQQGGNTLSPEQIRSISQTKIEED